MSGSALYTVGALLTWSGYAAAIRAIYLGLRLLVSDSSLDRVRTGRGLAIALVMAGVLLFVGSQVAATPALGIPLTWVVMPFAAWAVLVSTVLVAVRLSQAVGALNPAERWGRYKAAALWAAAGGFFAYLYSLDTEASIEFVSGVLPLSPAAAVAMGLLAVAAVAAMVLTARAARAKGWLKVVVTHTALLVGSAIFGLPFAWLVITSFKEDVDMSSPHGIVWIPRVQQTVPYFSESKPLYSAFVEGVAVQGQVIERNPDGRVKLDVFRPMSMRGTTVETTVDRIRETPLDAKLVKVEMDGQPVKGMVVEELEDGHSIVQALEPEALKGRRQVYEPAKLEPIRKVGLRLQNYVDALEYLPQEANKGLTYLKNTLLIVVLGLVATILSSAIVAYAFSRMRFPGRDFLFTLMLATMMLPGAVTKLPQFMIFRELGWIDTLYPLWVPALFGSAFNIFMLRQFFRQIPTELEDAAKIDGASYVRTFWSVMMPLIKPALAVIAIMTFVGAWNNFLDPLIYISSPENMTISYAVQLYASDRAGEPGLLTAFTTLSMAPVLALFFFAQKYFIEGVTLTGMGGR